jgi:DnaJ-class molecular chaperone
VGKQWADAEARRHQAEASSNTDHTYVVERLPDQQQPCDYCRGKGKLNAAPCPVCGGRGEVRR